jgi:hypothetical protein
MASLRRHSHGVGKPVESSARGVDTGSGLVQIHGYVAIRLIWIHAPSTVRPQEFTGLRDVIHDIHRCDDDNENLFI